jgi:hypothetical protein
MDAKELLDENISGVKTDNVWVYVNPLTGKHCKTSTTHVLAAFRDVESARSWEPDSKTLQKNVCYEVTWNEMISIAAKESGGKYVIL